MLIAGISIPVMAALNATLGQNLKSPAGAAVVLFLVGLVVSVLAVLYIGLPDLTKVEKLPVYYYMGGLSVAFYILSITWVAPKFGVGNAVFFVLIGQLISSAIIDHFGFFGSPVFPLTINRVLGLVLMALGLSLAVRA